jgi:hypothetical protein
MRQPQKMKRGLPKKTSVEKEATSKNAKGLIKKISEGKRGTYKTQKFPTNIHDYRNQLR